MKISRQTISIQQVIQSELIAMGMNEFENNGEWTFFNDDFSFLKKIMKYDDDVSGIVDEKVFQGETLDNPIADKHFKKLFIKKFFNRTINRQTIEAFSQEVVYTLLMNSEYINRIYENENFLLGKTITTGQTTDTKTNDNRTLHSDLPQSKVNLNVEDTVLDYGTTNTISRNKDSGQSDNQNETLQYNVDSLVKISGLLEGVMTEFDKNCFMQAF